MSTELWWYPTSYAVFLLIIPFLTEGLKSLGQEKHRRLCILCFIMWSIVGGLVSIVSFNMVAQNVLIFFYLYVLTTYWKWYGTKLDTTKNAIVAICVGYTLTMLSTTVLTFLTEKIGKGYLLQGMMGQNEWMLPVMLIGFGSFALFKQFNLCSRIINNVAKSTLAIYLISAHPAIAYLTWKYFNMSSVFYTWKIFPYTIATTLTVFFACLIIDYIRRALFAITVDKNKGRLFDKTWQMIERVCVSFSPK